MLLWLRPLTACLHSESRSPFTLAAKLAETFCCRTLPGDRQRILVGDVSSKGAAAAMTAALLGAAQRRESEPLAALFRHLNLVMVDMHGRFCDVPLRRPFGGWNPHHRECRTSGSLLQRAGNPDSKGLPMGIATETEYVEDSIQLAPGDSLTFICDGVVGARGPAGELFGFDRAKKSAASLPRDRYCGRK